ncbi:MAG: hypothetical protein V4565_09050 [Bacteroidota bacterium]
MKLLYILTLICIALLLCECKPERTLSPLSTIYEDYNDSLVGTKWIIIRYDNGTTPYYPNDTLMFLNDSKYSINAAVVRNNFTTYRVNGTYNISLTLYDCSTLGGSYAGQVPDSFNSLGEINNVKFKNLYSNSTINIWLRKI